MRRIVYLTRGTGLVFLLLACLLAASAGAAQRPLPDSSYSTVAACGAPVAGHAACLADGLVPETKAARSHEHPIGMVLAEGPTHGEAAEGDWGLRPQDLHSVYELPTDAPGTQTIGIVDAFDDPTIEADLQVYDEEFGLPACTTQNGCFSKLNQSGNASPLPSTDAEWAIEITLDVETAHAVCQNCNIVLVEAESNSYANLGTAVDTAVAAGANEVSNSYGGVSGIESSDYDHPGVVITASTGDWGYDNWEEPGIGTGGNYPATSPDVVAVGGTELSPFAGSWAGETAWASAGSGCSTIAAPAQLWQTSLPNWAAVGCGSSRAAADISADADPSSGVAIYDSTPRFPWFPGWATFGGTSLSSPIVAAEFALAGGSQGVEYPAQTVYANRAGGGLHDIASGSNLPEADCEGEPICSAGSGWDGPTGVGSPAGLGALQPTGSGTAPTVTEVLPPSGPSRGGQSVTILGTELADAIAVHFGSHQASVVADTASSITVETPANPAGVVDVTVTGSTGLPSEASPADQYEYTAQTPHITSIAPIEGATAGGTTVTLEGTGLGEIEMVEFGAGYFAVPDLVEANRVTVTTPAHPAGAVQVIAHGPFVDANHVLYTYGDPAPPQVDALTVHVSGSGAGSVAISPAGGSCSTTCSVPFKDGSEVTLSAAPAAGSTFAGWSGGGCSGTGICHLVLHGNAEVGAAFAVPSSTGPPLQTVVVPMVNPNGTAETHPQEVGSLNTSALAGCLAAAQKAYRRAARLAHSSRSGRAAKLRKAKQAEAKADAACHKRL